MRHYPPYLHFSDSGRDEVEDGFLHRTSAAAAQQSAESLGETYRSSEKTAVTKAEQQEVKQASAHATEQTQQQEPSNQARQAKRASERASYH